MVRVVEKISRTLFRDHLESQISNYQSLSFRNSLDQRAGTSNSRVYDYQSDEEEYEVEEVLSQRIVEGKPNARNLGREMNRKKYLDLKIYSTLKEINE
jgi:hypothetical protein